MGVGGWARSLDIEEKGCKHKQVVFELAFGRCSRGSPWDT